MLIETQPLQPKAKQPSKLRVALGVLITILTLWFVQQTLSWDALRLAVGQADGSLVLLGVLSIFATIGLKAWRWQLLFRPKSTQPTYQTAYNALMLNQFVNLIFFVRIGEVARVFYLGQSDSAESAQAVGTIIVEKWLELLAALLTLIILLLSVVELPYGLDQRTARYSVLVAALLFLFITLTFQSKRIIHIANHLYARLPARWESRLKRMTLAGLQGLIAMRQPQAISQQLLLSIGVLLLYVLTPFILFQAFALPYTFFDAIVLHAGIGLVAAIPSTPGKFGLLEVSTLAILQFLNPTLSELQLLSYAIIYHLVIIVPPLIWGGLIALRSDWSWKIR